MKTPILLLMFFSLNSFGRTPLPPHEVPDHPYLSPMANLHLDSYFSATSNNRAPASSKVEVKRYDYGDAKLKLIKKIELSMCLNFQMDNDGEFYGFCSRPIKRYLGGINFELAHFDKSTFKKKSIYTIMSVDIGKLIKGDLPLNLGYFSMDDKGRAIITDINSTVKFVGLSKDKSKFEATDGFSLKGLIPEGTQVAQVTPDYEGKYWFMSLGKYDKKSGAVTQDAYVGYYDMHTRKYDLKFFPGQIIENGFAVDRHGIYVITDHQMMKISTDQNSKIKINWAENYQRATIPKPGTISSFGSGTSPTLVGDDLVVFSDNADGQVNTIVMNRNDNPAKRLVCKVPTFKMNKSANENSVVSYKNSIIVQNWYNAPSYFGKLTKMEPGVARIDVREDRSGCDLIWENYQIAATSTLKLSTGSGYLYAAIDKGRKHYMAYIDFHTGNVDHTVYLNKGLSGRYLAAPVSFGPNNEIIQPHFSGMTIIKEK